MVSILIIIFIFSYTRKLIEHCSLAYWLQYVGQFLFGVSIGFLVYNIKKYKQRKKDNFMFIKEDIEWNVKNSIIYAVFGFTTGIVSTYLGIGGGMIVSPFLISMGINPEIIVATNSMSTFFHHLLHHYNIFFQNKY